MKKRMVLLVVVLALVVSMVGCRGVVLNAKYSDLLDRTAAVSAEMANRANEDKLSADDMKSALTLQAKTWQLFQDARDGKGGDE